MEIHRIQKRAVHVEDSGSWQLKSSLVEKSRFRAI
jgi:hypothetical protein